MTCIQSLAVGVLNGLGWLACGLLVLSCRPEVSAPRTSEETGRAAASAAALPTAASALPKAAALPETALPEAAALPAPSFTAPEPSVTLPPLGKCLDSEWAFHKWLKQGTEQSAQAAKLEQQGWAHYLAQRQTQAIETYCKAIADSPSASTYYKLGNSLQNVSHLEEALIAYDIALHLNHPTPERVHYNAACALSRLGRAGPAFQALDLAFDQGYGAIKKFSTDPDLEYLRQNSDWPRHAERYFGTAASYQGELVEYGDRDFQRHISFCPDQRLVEEALASVDGSCCAAKRYGTLEEKHGEFVAHWAKLCGKRGVGPGKPLGGESRCRYFKKCSEEVTCKGLKDSQPEVLIAKATLNGIRKAKHEMPDEPQTVFVQRGKFPRTCLEPVP